MALDVKTHPNYKCISCMVVFVTLFVSFSAYEYMQPMQTAGDDSILNMDMRQPIRSQEDNIQKSSIKLQDETMEDNIYIEKLYTEEEVSDTVADIDDYYTSDEGIYTSADDDDVEGPYTYTIPYTVEEGAAIPSTHYINGKYGGKRFTPPDVVGITSFNHKRENFIARNLPDFKPEMAHRTAQSLDFVIAGFPKTGTTFLTEWLNNDSIRMIQREQCQFGSCTGYSQGNELPDKKPITLINKLVHDRQEQERNGTNQKLAFKCPNLAEDDIIDELFSTYFPQTDLVIGLRHPIKWFNSFYNYRVKKELNPVPLVYELMGSKCEYGLGWKVCTDRAKFALPLARLGKTQMSAEELEKLVGMVRDDDHYSEDKKESIRKFFGYQKKPSLGRIFIYDLDQLADPDMSHLETFASDLTYFLKLDQPLAVPTRDDQRELRRALKQKDTPAPEGYLHYNGEAAKKRKWKEYKTRPQEEIVEVKHRHELLQIDICDPLYDDLRQELIKEGKQTSEWLLNYFLQSPEVIVSQRDRIEELIASYGIDPCIERE